MMSEKVLLTSTLCVLLVKKFIIHRIGWSFRWNLVESLKHWAKQRELKGIIGAPCTSSVGKGGLWHTSWEDVRVL